MLLRELSILGGGHSTGTHDVIPIFDNIQKGHKPYVESQDNQIMWTLTVDKTLNYSQVL